MRRLTIGIGLAAVVLGGCTSASGDVRTLPSVGATAAPTDAGATVPMAPVEDVTVSGVAVEPTPGVHDLEVEMTDASGVVQTRDVRVHLPDGPGPFNLVVALHPFGSSGARFDRQTGIGAEGAERGAVVALPTASGMAWNAALTCCQPAVDEGQPDVGFVLALADAIGDVVPVRPGLLLTGFSNGGYLSYRIACRASERVAAIAVVAGTMDEPCQPADPVSVLHLHGEDDLVVPFEDDRVPHSPQAASRGAYDVAAAWATLDGCDPTPSAHGDRTTWTDCHGGARVEFEGIAGLAHAWPVEGTIAVLDFLLHDRR